MEVHIMDSNKGFIKWLAGFLILGTIIGYLIVMSGQQKNDILICSELSRLGRSLFMIMDILNQCMNKEIHLS